MASKKTTPSKVAKQATKTPPTRSAATSSAILKLNEQDIRTLWSSFRNNGGTKNPNFAALGEDLGVNKAAAKWRFYKLKAIFEGDAESPKNAKTVTPNNEVKKGSKGKLFEDSGDESEASFALVSDGDSDQMPETKVKSEPKGDVKMEPDLDVKKEPDLDVKTELDLFSMEYYGI